MDLALKGKVFIVTGGRRGIGKGIACQLLREGAIPVILNRSAMDHDFDKEMTSLAAEHDTSFDFHQVELGNTDEIAPIIEATHEKYGRLDGIVNNAGANDNLALETTTWREFEHSLHQNLTHYYETVHAGIEYLKESRGAILNISSKTALTGQGKTSAYAAAKGAILGLTREWAAALADDGVRVNAIVVAECWTPLYANWITTFGDEAAQKARLALIEDKIPLHKRMTTTEEIGDAACFLLSERSSHTTGQWVHVDGGYVHLDRALS